MVEQLAKMIEEDNNKNILGKTSLCYFPFCFHKKESHLAQDRYFTSYKQKKRRRRRRINDGISQCETHIVSYRIVSHWIESHRMARIVNTFRVLKKKEGATEWEAEKTNMWKWENEEREKKNPTWNNKICEWLRCRSRFSCMCVSIKCFPFSFSFFTQFSSLFFFLLSSSLPRISHCQCSINLVHEWQLRRVLMWFTLSDHHTHN